MPVIIEITRMNTRKDNKDSGKAQHVIIRGRTEISVKIIDLIRNILKLCFI